MRTRRSDPRTKGWSRRRRGSGFTYSDAAGTPVRDPDVLERLSALAIPPAWREVWICPDPAGHIQAVGTDAAGRRQYRYHDAWRTRRDGAKFDRVLHVARRLPRLRADVERHLAERGPTRDRVLAGCVRILDSACLRIGGESYATGDEPSFGLATLRRDHVRVRGATVTLRFPAKSGVAVDQDIEDPLLARLVRTLLGRAAPDEELFAYRAGRTWADVRSADINDYLRASTGEELTAKDFRTWHATVLAATLLAIRPRPEAATARRKLVTVVMRETAELLGNTPAVTRGSYVDPRIVDLYHAGTVVAARLREGEDPADLAVRRRMGPAVIRLLTD
ncbi:DNA topoisomerase IB [Longispora sp. NPDC051575]|uniref:DNA topoisomerase IB n=1 Tax=Longispora sp. NPDC051575 TaxID=3154943 RepID=UPI0034232526